MLRVCRITFIEGIRSRMLYSIIALSVILMLTGTVFSQFFMQDLGKVITDFNLGAVSFSGLLISFSLSVGLISKDLDKRTIYFVLSRGISRRDYIFGKFVGLALIIAVSYAAIFALTLLPLCVMRSYIPFYFKSFSMPIYTAAVFADLVKCIFLNAVIIFFASFVTSSFSVLIFSLLTYIGGQTLTEALSYMQSSGLYAWHGTILETLKYIVPNFSLLDFKTLAASGISLPIDIYIGSIAYAAVYSTILLLAAGMIFSWREFP